VGVNLDLLRPNGLDFTTHIQDIDNALPLLKVLLRCIQPSLDRPRELRNILYRLWAQGLFTQVGLKLRFLASQIQQLLLQAMLLVL
jgi:hypothetical protein